MIDCFGFTLELLTKGKTPENAQYKKGLIAGLIFTLKTTIDKPLY